MREIGILIDGKNCVVAEGTTVAAALLNLGQISFRRSVGGEARAPLCGMGICFECCVTVDGHPGVRSCQELCRPGIVIESA